MTMAELKVGSKIWRFSENRRIYRKDAQGRSYGGPIWREHWQQVEITGETSRSWILRDKKIPKKGPLPWGYALDEQTIDRAAWVHDNSYLISVEVARERDYDKLQQIAAIVGYKEKDKP